MDFHIRRTQQGIIRYTCTFTFDISSRKVLRYYELSQGSGWVWQAISALVQDEKHCGAVLG